MDFKKLLEEMDVSIRQGQLGEAREKLTQISVRSIPREFAALFADLGRRLNTPKLMIKILKPIVRSEFKISPEPSERELLLYATALSRLGVFHEADALLKTLRHSRAAEIHFFQAQHYMLQWDFLSAIAKLKNYLKFSTISDYQKIVGMVNLAACLIWERSYQAGEETLLQIKTYVSKQNDLENLRLIYGYTIELEAEMYIQQLNFEKAEISIMKAEEILKNSKSRYEFYVKKWRAILNLFKDPTSLQCVTDLEQIRRVGRELSEWEVVRDCQFYQALATRNDELFIQVYNGSPYASYRKRIKSIYEPTFTIPKVVKYQLGINRENLTESQSFNLSQGRQENQIQSLLSQPLVYKLLTLLTNDFVRPVAIGSLISDLYPDEFFNPESSPQKAAQIINRLRDWFKANSIPLEIIVENETCWLDSQSSYAIQIERGSKPRDKNKLQLIEIENLFSDQSFSAKEVALKLNLSLRSAQRLLIWATKTKHVIKLASGASSRYRLKKVIAFKAGKLVS